MRSVEVFKLVLASYNLKDGRFISFMSRQLRRGKSCSEM